MTNMGSQTGTRPMDGAWFGKMEIGGIDSYKYQGGGANEW